MVHKMKKLVDHIHYANQFWHLAVGLSDGKMAGFFKRRKIKLQMELLTKFQEEIWLDLDQETSQESNQAMYVIRIKAGGDACHIPQSDLAGAELPNSLYSR